MDDFIHTYPIYTNDNRFSPTWGLWDVWAEHGHSMSQAVIQAAVEEGLDLGVQKGEEDAYLYSEIRCE